MVLIIVWSGLRRSWPTIPAVSPMAAMRVEFLSILVLCGPVRPYPDGIPAAVVVFDFYFLGGNAVYYIGNQRADIGSLRVQIDVDNRTSDIGRDQVEHLLCMGSETAYPEVVAQHDDRQVRANQKVSYVIIDLGEF